MKITRLSVTNYKSFGSNVNPVDDDIRGLKNINMVYGYNNSGKSNLLKFLHLIFQPKVTSTGIKVEGEGEKLTSDQEFAFWRGPILNSAFIFHKNNREKAITFE